MWLVVERTPRESLNSEKRDAGSKKKVNSKTGSSGQLSSESPVEAVTEAELNRDQLQPLTSPTDIPLPPKTNVEQSKKGW